MNESQESTAPIQSSRSLAGELAQNILAKNAARHDRDGSFPVEALDALSVGGLMSINIPADLGGRGERFAEFAGVVESLAGECASTGMIFVMHVAACASIDASISPKRASVLRAVAEGRHLCTLAASEKGTRSLFWMPVSALQDAGGEGATVSANKSWVTATHHADSYVATARSVGSESPYQSDCFFVFRDSNGVSAKDAFNGLGLRGNDSAPVQLTDYQVSADDMITTGGGGFEHLLGVVLPWFLVGTSAHCLGLMRKAIALTTEHLSASRFEHDGSRLADLANLRAKLAHMNTRASATAGLINTAITALEAGDPAATLHLLQARMFAVESAAWVADQAMTVGGGSAFSRHSPLERVFRDSLAGRVMAPTSDHLADLVGKALLGMELFG